MYLAIYNPLKTPRLIASLATGEESYRRGESGGGSQVSPEAIGNLLLVALGKLLICQSRQGSRQVSQAVNPLP